MAVTVEQARTELRRRAAVQELQRRAKATALMEFPDNLIPEEHREFGDKMRNASNYSLMFDELPEAMFDLEPELNETIYGEGTSSASAWTRTKQNVEEASLWQSTMKTWQRGAESVSIDFVWHAAATGKISEAEARKITKQFEARVKADPIKAKNWLENVYLKTVGIVPGMFGGYLEGAKYGVIGAGLGAGFAAGAGQVPPLTVLPEEAVTVPAGVLTGLGIGQAVGQIKFWSEQGYGAIYRQARMENVSKKTASIAASIGGPIYAAIEYSQVDKIIPGLAKLKSGLLKLSLRLAKNVAQEVAEEGAQRVVTDGAVLLSQIAEDEVKLADVPEEVKAIGQNAIDEMKEVVGPMVLLQAPGGATASLNIIMDASKKQSIEVLDTSTEQEVRELFQSEEIVPITVPKRELKPGEVPITKPERESLRDLGYKVPEIAAMAPAEARKIANKPVPPETFTPQKVVQELPTPQPELTEESKNAATVMERYWQEFDEKDFEIKVETAKNQQDIADALDKKDYLPISDGQTKDMSTAMMLYIDLKEHPEGHKFAETFEGKNKELYEQSQNLPANIKQIADRIAKQNLEAGKLAVERDVIGQARENYIAHLWEKDAKYDRFVARFRQTTARAKARRLEGGIAEGLSLGMTLRVDDITLASQIAQSQVNQAYVGKKLLQMGKDWGLLSHKQVADDWVQVEHPGFTTYRFRGTIEKPGKVEGIMLEKVPVYAEPELGKTLNNVFAPSIIYKIPGAETVTRYNAIIKSTILYTSLFHHQAFLRSYAFGSRGLNAVDAYKKGREAIMNMTPEVRLLVRNGMTIGAIQDYDPRMVESGQTIWGQVLGLTEPTEKANEWIQNLRRKQERFLFKKLGPFLKVQAGILELKAELERNRTQLEAGEITVDEIAAAVGNLMNNDFGGLHLGRMGRNNTVQHILRLLFLAPDWTESNVRSMIDAFRTGETGYMHRMFWGRIAIKGLGATVLFNLLLSSFDDDDFVERYRKAWREGRLRWLDIDITPINKAMGGKSDSRKYFSLIGHFRDPVKFVSHPGRSLKHKGSVVSRMVFDFGTGQDWAGREFTTIGELSGISQDGKLSGRLVKWSRGKAQFLEPRQYPSWFIYEGRQAMPIPIQNMASFIAGEMDGFDALTKSLGLMTSTTYPPKRKGTRRRTSVRR